MLESFFLSFSIDWYQVLLCFDYWTTYAFNALQTFPQFLSDFNPIICHFLIFFSCTIINRHFVAGELNCSMLGYLDSINTFCLVPVGFINYHRVNCQSFGNNLSSRFIIDKYLCCFLIQFFLSKFSLVYFILIKVFVFFQFLLT